jgi:hypothetical protein
VLICFEMFAAAVAHRKVFSYKDYRTTLNQQRQFDFWGAIKHSFDNRILWHQGVDFVRVDFIDDAARAAGGVRDTLDLFCPQAFFTNQLFHYAAALFRTVASARAIHDHSEPCADRCELLVLSVCRHSSFHPVGSRWYKRPGRPDRRW